MPGLRLGLPGLRLSLLAHGPPALRRPIHAGVVTAATRGRTATATTTAPVVTAATVMAAVVTTTAATATSVVGTLLAAAVVPATRPARNGPGPSEPAKWGRHASRPDWGLLRRLGRLLLHH